MTASVLPRPLRRALSPYTGIVRTLEECLRVPSEPPLFRFSCEVGRGDALLGSSLDHVVGIGGAGFTREDAAAAAVGEALERYSATYVPHERLLHATARELGDAAVAPERFALFSDRQLATPRFPFSRFDADTRVPWVEARSLPSGRRALVPAELVYLGDPVPPGGTRIGYATSSGTACAATRDEAVARGLCEVLERDAFMIAWTNRLSLPRLEWRCDERLARLDARYFAPTGLSYAAVDLSRVHGVPSVLGVVRSRRPHAGALGVGAGTGAGVGDAWWKALSEAFACRAASAKLALLDPERTYGRRGAGVVTFEDHIRYYASHDRAARAAFLDASRERVDVAAVEPLAAESFAERVDVLAARVAAAGASAYVVDVTSPDVAALGLVVTKVVAPELCALDVPHHARFLGGRRLYDAAATLGLRDAPLAEDDVNPEPHPFP